MTASAAGGSGLRVVKDVMVPMPDGTGLATDLHVPDGAPVPVLLHRLPYGKDASPLLADVLALTRAGYAVVLQDVRGRFRSGGRFTPFAHEQADGVATIGWLRRQPWCDGRVGMLGQSYHGATQWLAARGRPPGLAAIAPMFTAGLRPADWAHRGGVFPLGFALTWALGYLAEGEARARFDDVERLFAALPLDAVAELEGFPGFYADWLRRDGTYADLERLGPRPGDAVRVPALIIGGWYDCFLGGTLADHAAAVATAASPAAAPRLVVGPWAHATTGGAFAEQRFGVAADAAAFSLLGQQIRFFDHHLRGDVHALDDDPPVRYFAMGENRWRGADAWPPPEAREVRLHLHGGGVLAPEPPRDDEPPDTYTYDPADPVPTVGGQTFLPGLRVAANAGPRDQRAVEERHDVLCFTTAPLAAAVEVAGPVALTLFVASSAPETDFTGKLVDVHPDGRAMILTDGIVRVCELGPGAVRRVEIDLWATANRFLRGHRIRLEVASGNFPKFARNLNTWAGPGSARVAVAENRVFHDAGRPSHLTLAVTTPPRRDVL